MGLLSILGMFIPFGCSKQKSNTPDTPEGHMQPSSITVERKITVGTPVVIEGPSPLTKYSVVFEDDGDTGYFYGLDTSRKENPILDALHIYNVDSITDKDIPSIVQIVWSSDGQKFALVINRYPHAVFDFSAKRGYCRTNFPPAFEGWSKYSHQWDDSAIDLFK